MVLVDVPSNCVWLAARKCRYQKLVWLSAFAVIIQSVHSAYQFCSLRLLVSIYNGLKAVQFVYSVSCFTAVDCVANTLIITALLHTR